VRLGLAVLLGGLLATPAQGQERPSLRVDLLGGAPAEALVSVRRLLSEQRFLSALESGFPLYLEYRVILRQSRSWHDRTVGDPLVWEYVVLYDPVRQRFRVETPDSPESLLDRDALRQRLEQVYRVQLDPDGPGQFYYAAEVNVRTLSDQDVDETFAWLRGTQEGPGLLDKLARRLLVEVAPLPHAKLTGRSAAFTVR
jgi:hypothetical protein